MKNLFSKCMAGAAVVALSQAAVGGTDVYFNPLTQSAAVASPNHINELNGPWVTPAGISQTNLTNMAEIEADINQSVIRVDELGNSATMFDMVAFDPSGKFLFIPHETLFGAGVSRYDIEADFTEVLFAGDRAGANGDWSNDYGAFDPSRFTPNGTVIAGEEWSGEGRVIEILNPMAPADEIQIRELNSFANVSHEGIMFSKKYKDTIYYIDEYNSGSIYKFVMKKKGDYTVGQTFVLVVDDFDGDPAANWNDDANELASRTGMATWVPITDKNGTPLTENDPFKNGVSSDPRTNPNTFGGRGAADEVNGTPYGRPEDVEVGTLANRREVLYVAATSEHAIYSIEMLGKEKAYVRLFASNADTPKNLGFPATTGVLNSPDNLAQDALGNIYVIEDAPNGSNVGGDVWFVRDTDSDGVAESLDHFLSIQVDGSEATGMIFNPVKPTQFVLVSMHPDSTNLSNVPNGFGDAIWQFDLKDVVPPTCDKHKYRYNKPYHSKHRMYESTCSDNDDFNFVWLLEKSARKHHHWWK